VFDFRVSAIKSVSSQLKDLSFSTITLLSEVFVERSVNLPF